VHEPCLTNTSNLLGSDLLFNATSRLPATSETFKSNCCEIMCNCLEIIVNFSSARTREVSERGSRRNSSDSIDVKISPLELVAPSFYPKQEQFGDTLAKVRGVQNTTCGKQLPLGPAGHF
jgi:hypothetical protein